MFLDQRNELLDADLFPLPRRVLHLRHSTLARPTRSVPKCLSPSAHFQQYAVIIERWHQLAEICRHLHETLHWRVSNTVQVGREPAYSFEFAAEADVEMSRTAGESRFIAVDL